MSEELTPRGALILSVNRALLGEVTSSLRAVMVKREGVTIHLRFIFDGSISDDARESTQFVATEVNADFPDDAVLDECLRIDVPERFGNQPGWTLVFERKE